MRADIIPPQGEYGIACNNGRRLAWVMRTAPEGKRIEVAYNKGRQVEKWERFDSLSNFRVKWVPVHLRNRVECHSKKDAEQYCRNIQAWNRRVEDG